MRPALLGLVVLAACGLGGGGAAPAPVEGGSLATVEVTVEAVDGDSLTGTDGSRYRLIGINAPDRGECLADVAGRRLAQLAEGAVRLLEGEAETVDRFDRELVYVFTDGVDGRFVNEIMVAEGLALAVHSPPNIAQTETLFAAQEQARADRVGVWSPEACGSGPLANIAIGDVEADPPGPDEVALDDEWVMIVNSGDEAVDLTGWSIRDESTQNRFSFPPGLVLDPGDQVRVTSGHGDLGFGFGTPIWNNDGDTVYVVDDQGRFVTYREVGE